MAQRVIRQDLLHRFPPLLPLLHGGDFLPSSASSGSGIAARSGKSPTAGMLAAESAWRAFAAVPGAARVLLAKNVHRE